MKVSYLLKNSLMTNMKYRYLSAPVVFFCFLLLFDSCTSYKHFSYFEDLPDTSKPVLATTVPFKEPVIANGDLLSITIQTIDNDVSALLNSSYSVNGGSTNAPVLGTSTSGNGAQAVPNGYLVDKNGAVTLPFVGAVQISGMTTAEAKDAVSREVNKYFNNAVVNVRYANFRITVLGEVLHPATYIVPNEKINLFDGLAMAGDITVYGRRDNVVLVRDTVGQKKIIRFNMNNTDIVSSPWFYLQPNDVIYVTPTKAKMAATDAYRNRSITILAALIGLATLVVSRILWHN